jgi:hypothetical protein
MHMDFRSQSVSLNVEKYWACTRMYVSVHPFYLQTVGLHVKACLVGSLTNKILKHVFVSVPFLLGVIFEL